MLLHIKLLRVKSLWLFLIITFPVASQAQCDTSRWIAHVDSGGQKDDHTILNAIDVFQNGILTVTPDASFPNPYFMQYFFRDTFCITNNFIFEIRLKNDPAAGGAVSGDTWINLNGSNYDAGCLLVSQSSAQIYTSIYAGTTGAGNLPQLVVPLSGWRTIRMAFSNNVVTFSYDSTSFYTLPYNGSICNINWMNVGFREAGQVDWIRVTDANNNVVYFEDFTDCNNLALAPDCIAPVTDATSSSPSYCEGENIVLSGAANVSVQYSWTGPNGFSSSVQNPVINSATPLNSGLYILKGSVNPCTPFDLDSVFVQVNPVKSTSLFESICSGDSILLGGVYQKIPGIYYDTLSTALNCDSVIITTLAVLPVSTTNSAVSICDGDTYYAGGSLQTQQGVYYDTLINQFGCDSVIITNLSVIPLSYFDNYVTICQGDSYYAGGANQTTSGTYYDTTLNAAGCDSFATTYLTVIPTVYSYPDVFICAGDSFYAGGAFQQQAGVYSDTLLTSQSCDSVIVTQLSIIQPALASQSVSICLGETFYAGGAFQSQAGIYLDTFISSSGCDSILTTTLSIINPLYTSVNAEICLGESYYAGGGFQTQSGTYLDTMTAFSGCDSIITTTLTVINPVYYSKAVSICDNEFYLAGGALQNQSGIYYDTLIAATGCDSILITELIVMPSPVIDLGNDVSVCSGIAVTFDAGGGFDQYLWNDLSTSQTLSAAEEGAYWVTVTDLNGCTDADTVAISEVFPLPSFFLPADSTICGKISRTITVEGFNNYIWNDGNTSVPGNTFTIDGSGTYILLVTDDNGCIGYDTLIYETVCDDPVIMPNAFTPNGDGKNDMFLPVILDNLLSFEFRIYSRWNRLMFVSTDSDQGWDGTDGILPAPIETYIWLLTYTNEEGKTLSKQGNVILLR